MKSLKNHFSLILALVAILTGYQLVVTLDRMIDAYEVKLGNDYSLVLASSKSLSLLEMQRATPMVSSLESVDPTAILVDLKKDLSPENYELLRLTLPKFYRVRLTRYPSDTELKGVVSSIQKNGSVIKIESFAKSQSKIFQLLTIVRTMILTFLGGIFVIGFLLMMKQMEVWKYQHSVRMMIMETFGAPLWLRSLVLYRLGFVDALISSVLVGALFAYLSWAPEAAALLAGIGLDGVVFDPLADSAMIFGIALAIAIASVTVVIFQKDEEL